MIHVIDDPVADPRWRALVDRHPAASVFHTPAWLDALRRTYDYAPLVVTRSGGAQIESGIVGCRVRGFGVGRVVSLPFSDHCEPLVAEALELPELVTGLVGLAQARGWGRVELRPKWEGASVETAVAASGLRARSKYCLHELDLRPDTAAVFDGFHHSSTQRAIRRAEREGLSHDAGRSDEQLAAFFRLLRMARRRHGLPPQPLAWFHNLRDTMGERLTVHLARHKSRPVAAVLLLSFRDTVVYKYGGSDAAHHALGAMPFIFWRAIQAAKAAGARTLDLGRSDLDQPGLMAFKDHLGARRSVLTYYGDHVRRGLFPGKAWVSRTAGRIVAALPDTALDLAGRLLYRHLG